MPTIVERRHHPIPRTQARMTVGVATLFALLIVPGASEARRNAFCSETARLQYAACLNEVKDDRLALKAVCVNTEDDDDRADCLEEIKEARGEGNDPARGSTGTRSTARSSSGEDTRSWPCVWPSRRPRHKRRACTGWVAAWPRGRADAGDLDYISTRAPWTVASHTQHECSGCCARLGVAAWGMRTGAVALLARMCGAGGVLRAVQASVTGTRARLLHAQPQWSALLSRAHAAIGAAAACDASRWCPSNTRVSCGSADGAGPAGRTGLRRRTRSSARHWTCVAHAHSGGRMSVVRRYQCVTAGVKQ